MSEIGLFGGPYFCRRLFESLTTKYAVFVDLYYILCYFYRSGIWICSGSVPVRLRKGKRMHVTSQTNKYRYIKSSFGMSGGAFAHL